MGISQVDLGLVRMVRIRAVRGLPCAVARWPSPATTQPQLCIAVQLEGRCTVDQGECRLRLTPESWALCDATEPSRLSPEGRFDQVALFAPRSQFDSSPHLQTLLRQPLSGCTGRGRLVFESVRALATDLDQLAVHEAESLSGVVLRLVRIALSAPQVLRHASTTSLSEK